MHTSYQDNFTDGLQKILTLVPHKILATNSISNTTIGIRTPHNDRSRTPITMNGFLFVIIICSYVAGCSVAFIPLQQQKQQPTTLTRRFRLTCVTMTNHSTDTMFDLLEQQGVTITATLARMEKKLDKNLDSLDNKLDIIIILSVICAFLAQHFH
jgi:hypothetical protein